LLFMLDYRIRFEAHSVSPPERDRHDNAQSG